MQKEVDKERKSNYMVENPEAMIEKLCRAVSWNRSKLQKSTWELFNAFIPFNEFSNKQFI